MTTSRVSGMGTGPRVFQNFERRQAAVGAHDAAPGMGGRSTHVEVFDRGPVLRPTWDRAQKEKLFQRKLALENITFTQSPLAFEIERRDHLLMQDDVFYVRRVLRDGIDHVVSERFFLVVPVETGAKLVGRVLHEAGKNVLARRRNRGIGERGNDHVNVWPSREVAVFGNVV